MGASKARAEYWDRSNNRGIWDHWDHRVELVGTAEIIGMVEIIGIIWIIGVVEIIGIV